MLLLLSLEEDWWEEGGCPVESLVSFSDFQLTLIWNYSIGIVPSEEFLVVYCNYNC